MSKVRAELVVMCLSGGDADALMAAHTVWSDLDRSDGEWAVLTTRDFVELIVENSGAELLSVETWDGKCFGDGNCGVVYLRGNTIVHSSFSPSYVPEGYKSAREEWEDPYVGSGGYSKEFKEEVK